MLIKGWSLFSAAIIPDKSVQDSLISPLWVYAFNDDQPRRITNSANTFDIYRGAPARYAYTKLLSLKILDRPLNSPALGVMFAPLVFRSVLSLVRWSVGYITFCYSLATPMITTSLEVSTNVNTQDIGRKHSVLAPVVGGVVGGVCFIVLIALSGCLGWYRKQKRRHRPSREILELDDRSLLMYVPTPLVTPAFEEQQEEPPATGMRFVVNTQRKGELVMELNNTADPTPGPCNLNPEQVYPVRIPSLADVVRNAIDPERNTSTRRTEDDYDAPPRSYTTDLM